MCLDKVFKKPSILKDGEFHKTFRKSSRNNLRVHLQNIKKILPRGKWINEADYRQPHRYQDSRGICDTNGREFYPFGFHGFTSKKNAMIWRDTDDSVVVLKVKYRNAVAKGSQELDGIATNNWVEGNQLCVNATVIVAKEIFIPKE